MFVLGIDSSGRTASAALLEDDVVLSEYTANIGLTHSQTLLPMVAALFKHTGRRVSMLDGIAVSIGPGSFTGLRIGAATAKGLALPGGIPLLGVHTLDALAANLWSMDEILQHSHHQGAEDAGEPLAAPASPALAAGDAALESGKRGRLFIHPIMDARRHQVYTAAYCQGIRVGAEEALPIEELAERLSREPEIHRIFLGDAVPVYREYLDAHLAAPHSYASPMNLLQRASSVAFLGMRQLLERENGMEGMGFASAQGIGEELHLNYVRKPQAEREREAKGLKDFDLLHGSSMA